jgi:hypothetical protein
VTGQIIRGLLVEATLLLELLVPAIRMISANLAARKLLDAVALANRLELQRRHTFRVSAGTEACALHGSESCQGGDSACAGAQWRCTDLKSDSA